MPIYEYECEGCGHRFEALLARSGDAVPECPRCGAQEARKLPSAGAVPRIGSSSTAPPSCGPGGCSCCG